MLGGVHRHPGPQIGHPNQRRIFGDCEGTDPPQLRCGICTEKKI